MTVEYVHKAKTMHKISLSLRILKSGVTVVTSSAVERGLVLVLCHTTSHNANIFSEPCLFGYSYVCNSPFSSEDRASMCPVDKERRFVFCIHFYSWAHFRTSTTLRWQLMGPGKCLLRMRSLCSSEMWRFSWEINTTAEQMPGLGIW